MWPRAIYHIQAKNPFNIKSNFLIRNVLEWRIHFLMVTKHVPFLVFYPNHCIRLYYIYFNLHFFCIASLICVLFFHMPFPMFNFRLLKLISNNGLLPAFRTVSKFCCNQWRSCCYAWNFLARCTQYNQRFKTCKYTSSIQSLCLGNAVVH